MKHLSLDLALTDTHVSFMRVMCTNTKLACREALLVRLVPQFTYLLTYLLQLYTGASSL